MWVHGGGGGIKTSHNALQGEMLFKFTTGYRDFPLGIAKGLPVTIIIAGTKHLKHPSDF